jgi:dipeptide transport system substrate-binding protein
VFATNGISSARTGYSSKAFDDLTKAADKEADATKRDSLYNQAGKQLSTDASAAWVFYDQSKYLVKPWLKGINANPIDYGIPGFFSFETINVVKH